MRPFALAASFSCLGLCFSAYAEERSELKPIYVTSDTKTERALDLSVSSVQVITENDIKDMGAVTLHDIFANAGGIYAPPGRVSAAQGLGATAVSIRGVGASGTLWLVDGRRLAGEVGNPYDPDRIPASLIERIEIVKGPGAVMYGADSLGGVINIITKRPREGLEGMLDLSGGANTEGEGARYALSGDLRGGDSKTQFVLNVSALKGEPYTETENARLLVPKGGPGADQKKPVPPSQSLNPQLRSNLKDSYPVDVSYRDESEVYNVGVSLSHRFSEDLRIGMDGSFMQEDRDGHFIAQAHPTNFTTPQGRVPAFQVPIHQTDDNRRYDLGVTADWKAMDTLGFKWRSYQSTYKKRNSIFALNWRDMGYANEQVSASVAQNADVVLLSHELTGTWTPVAGQRVVAGAEYRTEDRTATVFNVAGTPESRDVSYKAVYAQHEWSIMPDLDLIYGARYDEPSTSEGHTSAKIGGIYTFTPAARLRANFSQGFRVADIRELYINRITTAGMIIGSEVINPLFGKLTPSDLVPETSNNFELGLGGSGTGWRYDAALFHNDISDLISQATVVVNPSTSYRTFKNISNARIQGIEASGSYRLLSELWLNASATLLNAENLDTGKRLEFTPEQLFIASADWRATAQLKLRLEVQHVGDQYYTYAIPGNPVAASAIADQYTLVNLRATYTPSGLPDTELYAGLDNIFDAEVNKILGSSVGVYLYAGARKYF